MSRAEGEPLWHLVGQRARVVDAKTAEGVALYDGARGTVVRMGDALWLHLDRDVDRYVPLEGPDAVIVERL